MRTKTRSKTGSKTGMSNGSKNRTKATIKLEPKVEWWAEPEPNAECVLMCCMYSETSGTTSWFLMPTKYKNQLEPLEFYFFFKYKISWKKCIKLWKSTGSRINKKTNHIRVRSPYTGLTEVSVLRGVGPTQQDKRSVFVQDGEATRQEEEEECSIPHVHAPHRRGNKVISS